MIDFVFSNEPYLAKQTKLYNHIINKYSHISNICLRLQMQCKHFGFQVFTQNNRLKIQRNIATDNM